MVNIIKLYIYIIYIEINILFKIKNRVHGI